MTTRRSVRKQPDITDIRGAYRAGIPECWRCGKDGQPGFVGHPNDDQSPYLNCGGDPAKHQRQPVRTGATP